MFAALEGKLLIDRDQGQRTAEKRRELLRTAKEICELDRAHSEKLAEAVRIRNNIEGLTPWLPLGTPLRNTETKRAVMFPGTMPGGTTLESVYGLLEEKAPEAAGADVQIVSAEQSMVYLAVTCLKEDAGKVEDALRSAGFARPSQMWERTPSEEKKALEDQAAAPPPRPRGGGQNGGNGLPAHTRYGHGVRLLRLDAGQAVAQAQLDLPLRYPVPL